MKKILFGLLAVALLIGGIAAAVLASEPDTVHIVFAQCWPSHGYVKNYFEVTAVSSAAPDAKLTVVGFGMLHRKPHQGNWYVNRWDVDVCPPEVTVTSTFGGQDTAPAIQY